MSEHLKGEAPTMSSHGPRGGGGGGAAAAAPRWRTRPHGRRPPWTARPPRGRGCLAGKRLCLATFA